MRGAAGLVSSLRGRFHLLFGFLHVGVVEVLLLLLEGLGCGNLFGAGLGAGGQKLLERSTRDVGVGVEAGGREVIRMRNHTVAGVGSVADVAVFDVDMFATADVGDADGYVLRGRGDVEEQGGEEREKSEAWRAKTAEAWFEQDHGELPMIFRRTRAGSIVPGELRHEEGPDESRMKDV